MEFLIPTLVASQHKKDTFGAKLHQWLFQNQNLRVHDQGPCHMKLGLKHLCTFYQSCNDQVLGPNCELVLWFCAFPVGFCVLFVTPHLSLWFCQMMWDALSFAHHSVLGGTSAAAWYTVGSPSECIPLFHPRSVLPFYRGNSKGDPYSTWTTMTVMRRQRMMVILVIVCYSYTL